MFLNIFRQTFGKGTKVHSIHGLLLFEPENSELLELIIIHRDYFPYYMTPVTWQKLTHSRRE